MARMWTFHVSFVLALSPLFVKIWRLKQLVGGTLYRRVSISNTKAAIYTLPMIMTQIILLLIVSLLDPPRATESIQNLDGVVIQKVVCAAKTDLLLIVEVTFEAGVVLVGCFLYYLTRNLDAKFGEAKQLIFAMYNIALVGVIIVLVISFGQMNPNGNTVLQAVGVFWGAVVSSAAFVLPRVLEIREEPQGNKRKVQVTGLDQHTAPISGVLPPANKMIGTEEQPTPQGEFLPASIVRDSSEVSSAS